MKRLLLLPVILLTFAIGGCATLGGLVSTADGILSDGKSILQGGTSITASIANPVTRNDMVAIESAYRAGLVAAVNYRRFCYAKPNVADLPAVCKNRRSIVLALQSANRKVRVALVNLRAFVRNNDTISAWSAVGAVRAAISDFQAVAAANGVT